MGLLGLDRLEFFNGDEDHLRIMGHVRRIEPEFSPTVRPGHRITA
jgi:hypothetical protein